MIIEDNIGTPISYEEAIRLSRETLERAERERLECAQAEAKRLTDSSVEMLYTIGWSGHEDHEAFWFSGPKVNVWKEIADKIVREATLEELNKAERRPGETVGTSEVFQRIVKVAKRYGYNEVRPKESAWYTESLTIDKIEDAIECFCVTELEAERILELEIRAQIYFKERRETRKAEKDDN